MSGRVVLLIGATVAALGGTAAGVLIAGHGGSSVGLSEGAASETGGELRPPTTEPAATTSDPGGTTTTPPVGPVWDADEVLRRIDGASVRVDGRRVRIESDTALCSGSGGSRLENGIRRWQAFDCTYTVFEGGIDRDLEFRVDVVDGERYRLSDFRWLGGR